MIKLYVNEEHLYDLQTEKEVLAWMDMFPALYNYIPENVRTEYVDETLEDE